MLTALSAVAPELANVDEAIRLAGPCYSRELARCANTSQPSSYPGCEVIRSVLHAGRGRLNEKLESLPLCEADFAWAEQTAALLPPCYSQELDDCLQGKSTSLPGCDAINELYDLDERLIEQLPFCAPPRTPWGEMVAAAGAALVLGFFVGRLL